MATEIETKLVVIAEDPQTLMDEIACRERMGDYLIKPLGTRTFTDTYYDTLERTLTARGVAVRTRHQKGSVIFCIKESERIREDGAAFREELEMPWSARCIEHIERVMQNGPVGKRKILYETDASGSALASLGLFSIQTRQTRRNTCEICSPGLNEPLAELALDAVRYCIRDKELLHHEIEVEARNPSSELHMTRFTGLLRTYYPDNLMRWDHNKLVTGMAMDRLMTYSRISSAPQGAPCLDRSSYHVIDAYLKNELQ